MAHATLNLEHKVHGIWGVRCMHCRKGALLTVWVSLSFLAAGTIFCVELKCWKILVHDAQHRVVGTRVCCCFFVNLPEVRLGSDLKFEFASRIAVSSELFPLRWVCARAQSA